VERYIPHRYQTLAEEHIIHNERCALFLDMGLGKTVVTLSAIDYFLFTFPNLYKKVLVIAPLRVADITWTSEIEKWEHLIHLRVSKVLGSAEKRRKALYADADIYIVNRENIPWLVNELDTTLGYAWEFDICVIDELSSFKSHSAERFKSLKKVIGQSKRVVGLTGTPTPNGMIDLWSQVYLLDGGKRLGKNITAYREAFFSRYMIAPSVFNYVISAGAEQEITNRISDICMSMKAEDWIEVPERLDVIHLVRLTDAIMAKYRKFERDSYIELMEGTVTAYTAGALTQKLLQYSNGAMYHEEGDWIEVNDSKLDALEEIIDASQGKPILVFYSFKHDLERIKRRYKKARKLESRNDVDMWNRGEVELLVAHPASCGHGLNLQAGGNIIVWFGLTWSLELYQQANARLHRQGQKEKVIIHHLITAGTVDEIVMQSLKRKTVVQDELIEALKVRYK